MAAPQDYFQRIDLTDTSGGGDSLLDRTGDNVREDFMNAIYNISPTQAPFMSGIGRESCSDTFTSWQQDDLAEPNDANAAKDGADIGTDSSSNARRVGNTCQISTKSLIVSGRADKVNKAGRSSELSYQLAKAAKALKRDMEAILTGNVSAVADLDGNTAPLMGGLRACFRDAASPEQDTALVGATGANGGVGADGIPDAATAGTERALTQTLLDTSIEAIYNNGGEADTIMVSPAIKRVLSAYLFSSSARVAALYSDVGQKRSNGGAAAQSSVDVYISDFGALKIIPNRYQGYQRSGGAGAHAGFPTDDVFILDMSLWATGYLRPFQTKKVASSGDATKRLLLVDYTLIYKQEMGNGVVADIDRTAAMTA
jgi:hypothetical protein